MNLVQIRQAAGRDDAAGIAGVLATIANERVHSAIEQAWTPEEQLRYLDALSPREAIHVALDETQRVIGCQTLDLWSPLKSMRHAGQLGTFVLPEWRGRGVGKRLWAATRAFAMESEYRKLVIQVRGSNLAAQAFYRGLGFQQCGLLSRQVILDGIEDDELLLEMFL